MKKQKGFIKILFVVIFLIFIAGAYFIYNKKSDNISPLPLTNHNNSSSASSPYPMKELTREEDLSIGMADWKTYRNDKYGFEFKYPSELLKYASYGVSDCSEVGDFISEEEAKISSMICAGGYLSVEIQNDKLNTLEFAVKDQKFNRDDYNPNFPQRKVSDISDTVLSGKKGYKFSVTDYCIYKREGNGPDPKAFGSCGSYISGDETILYFLHKGVTFMIIYPSNNSEILKTFKFID